MKSKQSVGPQQMPADSRPHSQPEQPDFCIYGTGTVFLFEPLTEPAKQWLKTHCPAGSEHQYFGEALAVERRYLEDIVLLATLDGLRPVENSSQKICRFNSALTTTRL